MININKRDIIFLTLILFSLFAVMSSANAANVTLDKNNYTADNIALAGNGDYVYLDTSQGNIVLDSSNVNIQINNNITIQSSNPTKNAVIDANYLGRVLYINAGTDVKIVNITFINGNHSDSVTGCVIYNYNAKLTLIGCNFTNNFDGSSGGAVYNNGGGTISVINCTFSNNSCGGIGVTSGRGGAINNLGKMDLFGCTFLDNKALGNFGDGGAIYNNGILNVNNCIFIGNIANRDGVINGGNTSKMNITGCEIINNNKGIYIDSGVTESSTINYNIIFNNSNYNIKAPAITNADLNWWGSNQGPSGLSSGVTANSYFEMSIATAVSNLTRHIDESLALDYSFVLNGTEDNGNASSNFGPFTVDISVNGVLWQKIDASKSAQYNVPLTVIANEITAQLNDEISTFNYTASPKIDNGTDTKIGTTLVITNFKALYNKSNTIKVTATDKNGKLLAKKQVTLYINGKPIKTVTTNSAGVASFKYKFTTRKVHKIVAKFTEDTTHASSNSKTLSLTPKDKTTLKLAKVKAKFKKIATFKATLKNHKKKAMAKKYVKFYANKKYLGKAKTNKKGVAILNKKVPVKGTVKFIAKYAGTKTYHSSDATRKVKVKK